MQGAHIPALSGSAPAVPQQAVEVLSPGTPVLPSEPQTGPEWSDCSDDEATLNLEPPPGLGAFGPCYPETQTMTSAIQGSADPQPAAVVDVPQSPSPAVTADPESAVVVLEPTMVQDALPTEPAAEHPAALPADVEVCCQSPRLSDYFSLPCSTTSAGHAFENRMNHA